MIWEETWFRQILLKCYWQELSARVLIFSTGIIAGL